MKLLPIRSHFDCSTTTIYDCFDHRKKSQCTNLAWAERQSHDAVTLARLQYDAFRRDHYVFFATSNHHRFKHQCACSSTTIADSHTSNFAVLRFEHT